MKLWKRLICLAMTCALCAALLAACGSSETAEVAQTDSGAEAADTTRTPESAETPQPAESAAEETPAQPAENVPASEPEPAPQAAPAYDGAALVQALNDCCNVGPGAAGSNLRAVKAAGELVVFAANGWTEGNKDAIQGDISAWYAGLDEESVEELRAGWEMVSNHAQAIAESPGDPDILGMLEDAGLPDLKLSEMDLSHTTDLLNAVRFVLARDMEEIRE